MQTLMERATALCLALTVRHVASEPTFADAAALCAGRVHLWSRWPTLPDPDKLILAQFLRYRPNELAQPETMRQEAQALLAARVPLFELADAGSSSVSELKENQRFRLSGQLQAERMIAEQLDALINWHSDRRPATLPETGDLVLKHIRSDSTRVFVIPASQRTCLDQPSASLTPHPSPCAPTVTWRVDDIAAIAHALDGAAGLHNSHHASVKHLLGERASVDADAGIFYRVNAPTGAGKSVLMLLMALDAARRNTRVVIAVPNLTDVRNMVAALKRSAAALRQTTTIAPLHSQRKIAQMAGLAFMQRQSDHPYHYACLLDTFATDGSSSVPDAEPCFNLYAPYGKQNGEEGLKRLGHCPLLFKCGKATMLDEALQADIIVVNHHALLSGSTRIPVAGQPANVGPRSSIELLLARSQVFLVDEIDGLLQSAISSSVFELELGSHHVSNMLSKLRRNVEFPAIPIADMKPASLGRVRWALTYCTLTVNELLGLHQSGYFNWPKKETTWPSADDGQLKDMLGIDSKTLDNLFAQQEGVPDTLRTLQNNLSFWARNDGNRAPEAVALELQQILDELAAARHLAGAAKPRERERLKASLMLRGRLAFLERHLRNLQHDLPALIRANVEHAQEVQQSLKGPEPFSPTPNGPLHRTVYGFKRKEGSQQESALHVVAMRGDPHRTLLALPELTSLGHAGAKRLFIGFSATAYFPGASCFDLPAEDLIDVPDMPGHMQFENVAVTVAVSGAPLNERGERVRALAKELWPWLEAKLASLAADPATSNRARLLLVTGSDEDAGELAAALIGMPGGAGKQVLQIGGTGSDVGAHRVPQDQKIPYSDLVTFAQGPHASKRLLVSSIFPMARGHNIVNDNSESAIGAIVVCVRPLPSSDRPGNNLAHICYETGNQIAPSASPGEGLIQERKHANAILYAIRNSSPAFSQQPANVRHYTVMNILVTLTQLMGRARRGGTPVTCYLADAAFFDSRTSWAGLLKDTVERLRIAGDWPQFARHHAALATALTHYIHHSAQESA